MNTRRTCLSISLLALALAIGTVGIGAIAVPHLEAAPVQTKRPIDDRLRDLREACKWAKGDFVVVEGKLDNGERAVAADCSGSSNDESNFLCVLTETTTDCDRRVIPTRTLPGVADPNRAQVADPGAPEATPILTGRTPGEVSGARNRSSSIERTSVTPTAAATEAPVTPTAAATEAPVTPTAVTGDPPAASTVPTNDNTEPPGEAEDST